MAEKIINLVAAGNTFETAARSCGLGLTTFKTWMRGGRSNAPGDAESRAFRTSVKMARTSEESEALVVIRQAARDGTWQAAWFLERSNPRRWGKVDRFKAEITAREDDRPLVSQEVQMRLFEDPVSPNCLQDVCAHGRPGTLINGRN